MGACNIKPFPSLNAMLPKDRLDCLHTLLQVHPTCFAQIVVIPQSLWCQHHRKPWTLAGCSPLLFRISLCSLTAFFFFFTPSFPENASISTFYLGKVSDGAQRLHVHLKLSITQLVQSIGRQSSNPQVLWVTAWLEGKDTTSTSKYRCSKASPGLALVCSTPPKLKAEWHPMAPGKPSGSTYPRGQRGLSCCWGAALALGSTLQESWESNQFLQCRGGDFPSQISKSWLLPFPSPSIQIWTVFPLFKTSVDSHSLETGPKWL